MTTGHPRWRAAAACALWVVCACGCENRATVFDKNQKSVRSLEVVGDLERRAKPPELTHPQTPRQAVEEQWLFGPRTDPAGLSAFDTDPRIPLPSSSPSRPAPPVVITEPPRGLDGSPALLRLEAAADGRLVVERSDDRREA